MSFPDTSPTGDIRRIRILCQNVFWFQGAPFAPEMPGEPVPQIFEDLVSLYSRLDPDVICLQEVQSEAVFGDLLSAFGMEGTYCPGGVLAQYGGVMMWKTGSKVADPDWLNDPPQRMWQMAVAPGSGELTVCNVHLPSNRQLGRERSRVQRVEELRAATSGGPNVVVGDFNEAPGGAVGEFMQSTGFLDAAEVTGKANAPTSINGNRGDQIWIQAAMANRLVAYGVATDTDLETSVPEKSHLSDHLPLWIDIEIGHEP
jgi:endonuclease/exonuclease/phosphatase family metal-dependent hydrolase